MGRGRKGTGVEARDHSIRVSFMWNDERCREPLELDPTPPNMRYAARLVEEIKRKINAGTFTYTDYFPKSKRAGSAGNESQTLEHLGKLWLAGKGRLASSTRSQYSNALNVWYELFGKDTDIRTLSHGQVAAKIGSHAWAGPKLCNNYLIPLRGVFRLAARDLRIANPVEGIDNTKLQKAPPDPFTIAEMEAILADLEKHYDERVWCYFAYAFATGMRPEEEIAQRWPDIDFRHAQARVERAKTFHGEVKAVKTYQVREVDLLDRALAVLARMKPHTYLKAPLNDEEGGYVFENPVTGRPWHDERSQRDHYWKPALRRLGIRYRAAYQTRHTYATIALMGGVNPAYIARQLGHKNAKMLFEVYAKWIDGADRGREKAKVEAALRGDIVPNLSPEPEKAGRRDWTRTNKKPKL